MSSPIRFRAFYHGRMLDVFAVNPMNQTVYLSHQHLYDEPGNDVLVPIRSEIEPDGAVLMQWTGLRAVEGTDIYDGDIVRTGNKKYGYTFVVSWGTLFEGGEDGDFEVGTGFNVSTHDPNTYVVLGNVHQHPELIGGK